MNALPETNHTNETNAKNEMKIQRSGQLVFALSGVLLFSGFAGCKSIEDAFAGFLPVLGGSDAPRVMSSLPTPGQRGVQKDSPVLLTFNKRIDQQKCIGAFSVQPPLPGVFDFTEKEMIFTSSRQFRGGETYIISLTQDCEDNDGVDLAEQYFASFSTSIELSPPFIASASGRKNATGCLPADLFQDVYPNTGANSVDICRQSPIVINFNESMDRGSVERSVNVIPNIVGAFVWSNNDSRLEFRPRDQLENGVTYVVNVAETARDVAENQMTDPITFSFTVGNESERPLVTAQDGNVDVAGCTPGVLASIVYGAATGLRNANGVCSSVVPGNQNSPVIIDFSEDMDLGTVDAAFNISPPINGNKVWGNSVTCGITTGSCGAGSSQMTFTPIQPWLNATTYTVSVQPNATDVAGNLMATQHVFSFTIGTDPNLPRVVMQDGRVANGGVCTLVGSQTAFGLDPINGLRNQVNVCSSSVSGDTNTPVIIQFNEDMEIGSVDAAFNISPPINGTKGWASSVFCAVGAGTCTANQNQLTFTPNQPWQVGVTYTVSVGGGARDAAGNAMGAPHVFSFTTGLDPEPPNVVTQDGLVANGLGSCTIANAIAALVDDPVNGLRNQQGVCSSNVAGNANSPIIIDFSEDMDISTTDGAFSISPPLNGSKAWSLAPGCGTTLGTCAANSSRLTFTPIQPWLNATTYSVTINGAARDAAGLNLSAPYAFSFTVGTDTVPPTVTNVFGLELPNCVLGTPMTALQNLQSNLCFLGGQQRIRVDFDEAMDPPVTAGAFSISPSVAGGLDWLPNTCETNNPTTCTQLLFTPTQALTLNQQYQITVSGAAQDIAGNRLAVPHILYVTTSDGLPADVVAPNLTDLRADVLGVACDGDGSDSIAAGFVPNVCTDNAGSGAGAVIRVVFDEAMDQALTASAFSITPSVSGFITFAGNDLLFIATQALNPTTQYRVTVGNGARDPAGNTLIGAPYTRFFNTTAAGGYPGVTTINIGTGAAPCAGGAVTDMLTNNITNACENANTIEVTFTEAMNQTITENAFSTSPRLDGVFTWPLANLLRFTPDRAIDPNRRYDVQLSTSVEDFQGHKLQGAVNGSFIAGGLDATPPTVVQVRFEQPNVGADPCVAPADDTVAGGASLTIDVCRAVPIEIQFSEPMNQGTTSSAVNVTSATYAISWPLNDTMRITPLGSGLDSGSSHNLTVGTGAQDLGGNNIALQFALSFVVENTSPRVDAIGLESHGPGCDAFGDNGTAVGTRNWTAGACWWDADLPIRSPLNYTFQGQDLPCGFSTGTQDNVRIIFSKPMDTSATINAIRLRRLSPPIHTIQLGRADWSDGNRVVTLHFAAQEAVNCPGGPTGANSFGGGDLDLGPTNVPAVSGLPLYSIEVERSARDATGETLPANFFFVFEGD